MSSKAKRLRKLRSSDAYIHNALRLPVVEPLIKIQNIDLRCKGKAERRKIAEESFILNEEFFNRVRGEKILIIDDVITSCSTVSKCARLLTDAGAESVNVLAAGRTGYDDL